MRRAWRFRKCPACGAVRAAGEYRIVGSFRPGWRDGDLQRACPACGHIGRTYTFPVVREKHAEAAR
jgi:predicted RNA-binding Zn-ribbon protein involved in translation (DUF1610 family)